MHTYVRTCFSRSGMSMYMHTYVRTCFSRSGMSICAHVHAEELMCHIHVHCTDTRGCRSAMEDGEERRFLTMEDRWDNEKVQKQKARCGESSQTRYKLCSLFIFNSAVVVLELWLISDYCSTWPTCMRNAHICTGTARRETSCACVVLVLQRKERKGWILNDNGA